MTGLLLATGGIGAALVVALYAIAHLAGAA